MAASRLVLAVCVQQAQPQAQPRAQAPSAPPAAASTCPIRAARLGPSDAPLRVEVFADPAARETLVLWMELLRLVGEQEGRTQVQVIWSRPPLRRDEPRHEEVRAFVLEAHAQGVLLPALRVVARDGVDRVFARLQRTDEREALWHEVGVERSPQIASARFRASLDCGADLVMRRIRERRSIVYRLPAFVLGEEVFEDVEGLVRLRPLLAAAQRTRAARGTAPEPTPAPSDPLPHLRAGMVVGGIGLPHRFVLIASDEDDPNLFLLLPPLLDFRERHPGVLSVQVVARGGAVGAMTLRHRLCAARRIDRVMDYVDYLQADPLQHNPPNDAQRALLKALDGVPAEVCERDPDPAERGLPTGAWLDDQPQTRSDLEALDDLIADGDARAPLSGFLRPGRETSDKPASP